MSNNSFKFKQFTIFHDRCAMKVGTDGVLLGVWARVEQAKRILDIGTGTGLIAIMMAQRAKAQIMAIDILPAVVEQAYENISNCLWNERIEVRCEDVCNFIPENHFDTIVSNPPYFERSLLPPDDNRMHARHTKELSFDLLIRSASRLLEDKGTFQVIIPYISVEDFTFLCWEQELYLSERMDISMKEGKLPKRSLLLFRKKEVTSLIHEHLILTHLDGTKTEKYIRLTEAYYL